MQKDRRNRDQKSSTAAARASSRSVERRMERERERRRQRMIMIAVTIGALALVVAVALILANQPSDAPIPPESAARYEGLTMTRTTEGYARLGDPDAPVQVAEYSSFGCPSCKEFHDQAIDAIVERVRNGDIAFTYVPLWQTGSVANAQGAARAGVCAAEQGRFWELHDAFFNWQTSYGNQAFTNSRILSGVGSLEMNRAEYDSCIGSGTPGEVLNRAQQQANALINFLGTPTITINGVVPVNSEGTPYTDPTDILAAIDSAIAAAASRQQPAPVGEVTPEATDFAIEAATLEPLQTETVEASSDAVDAETAEEPVEAATPEVGS